MHKARKRTKRKRLNSVATKTLLKSYRIGTGQVGMKLNGDAKNGINQKATLFVSKLNSSGRSHVC